ncbi:hypothetical protein ACKRZS_013836 [Fusarium odoratissimum]
MEIIRICPRFGLMLLSMVFSIIFITVDILSVTPVLRIGYINPFWKFAFIFKCFTDMIVLDDFKTALDRLSRHKMEQNYPLPFSRPSSRQRDPDLHEICRYGTSDVTIEHMERVDNPVIRAPPRTVSSDAGVLGRTY